ncbi:HEPN/Toprim-associated domain-containing protein [Deinococcus marmoris]|uniref:HEPN/Toprim N-terminal domain-containing protein n=1 Tax=Deinococcus marmoris TaxID=249408 RepID=A0A1U7P0N3_9DEIO|nr:HEPN/Toprim-associated domain-containing protein [Deinococcus marmoris]OLV18735.1 hypothetical protein BOO71_0004912 [Deinococcus marmoris]
MGAYAELYFDSSRMLSIKNGVPYDLLSVFSDREREVLSPTDFHLKAPFIPFDLEMECSYYIYQTQASFIKDRLDLMGINLKNLEVMFNEGWKDHKEFKSAEGENPNPILQELRVKYNSENDLKDDLHIYNFDYWKNLVKLAVESNISLDNHTYGRFDFLGSETFSYHQDQYGFPNYYLDFRYLLRILLEYLPGTQLITLDYTDLALNDYESADEMLCERVIESTAQDYSINEKIVVLTEGSTDLYILKNCLRFLSPHVQDNFAFADFSEVNAQGGTSSLISSIKVLISMSIKNRVLAIFDADAASLDALRGLININVPKNICTMLLPELELARQYPKIGPTGINTLDINSLACSIELYLPEEMITDNNDELYPIHWRGYIPSIQKYQGEIVQKREIMSRFVDAVKKIDRGEKSIDDFNWSSMRCIFSSIFTKLSGI